MKRFETSGAPYLQPEASVSQMMTRLLLSLVPAAAVYTWFFGPGLLLNILVASAVGLMAEALVLSLRK